MPPMHFSHSSCGWPISIGLAIGPLACSSRVLARPSQNCSSLYARLNTVGALRPPSWPRMPLENGCPSVNASFGSWQVAHETVLSADSRLSKYRSQPSSAFSGVYGLSLGQKISTSPSGTFGPSLGNINCRSCATKREGARARQVRATSPAAAARGKVMAGMGNLQKRGARNGLRFLFRSPRSALLLDEPGHVEGPLAVDLRQRAGDIHDVGHVLDGGLAEVRPAVAARVVLLLHQQVELPLPGQEADRLAVLEALLAAVAVLGPVLADLQVARVVDDLADERGHLRRQRLAVDGG